MKARKPGAWRWALLVPRLGLLLTLLTGCSTGRLHIDRALLRHADPVSREANSPEAYCLSCPDLLWIEVDGRVGLKGRREIGPDGRIDLGNLGRLRVEGLTVAETARRLAELTEVRDDWVRVRVVEYNSRHLYLVGQVVGPQRILPYQGPERVLDVLQRAGGITAGAAPDEVYVVRTHFSEQQPPEVFRVELKAILLHNDSSTNIYIEPDDQIYVGETRPCVLEKWVPPWFRPIFESFWGMRRPGVAKDTK
jgi:polysaccharide biosynthesis/export protein